jgi:type VI secretion system secreted protein VgrG
MSEDNLSASALTEVAFEFAVAGVSAVFNVVSLHLTEAVSEPFNAVLEIATEEPDSLTESLLGKGARLKLDRGLEHHLHGLVAAVEDRGTTADQRVYEVVVVPQLWLLSQRRAYRIFQEMHALAIVKEVLQDAGVYLGGPGVIERVEAPAVREYCVQFGETDLEFVRRLLDEAGLAFGFEHTAEGEGLVIFDPSSESSLSPALTSEATLPIVGHGLATNGSEGLSRLDTMRELVPGALTVADWDFTHASAPLRQHARREGAGGLLVRDYPARVALGAFDEGSHLYGPPEGKHARRRLQAAAQRAQTLRGAGNAAGFAAGKTFSALENRPRGVSGRFLVTRVVHLGHCPEVLYTGGPEVRGLDRYSNTFECSPLQGSHVWRPVPLQPRPRVDGPQTATVVAEAGSSDEICTDHYGRVLVRFHWDADGGRVPSQQSKRASCWIRTAQSWAGASWGFLFVPRVGMEVIVQFLDGDPDRPIITGCAYNGSHPTPVKLPEKKTQSVIRTQSSPGGAGYNELRFEDAAGAEHLWLRAQKDFTEHVLHDHRSAVDHDETTAVKHDSFLEVGNDRAVVVKGHQKHTVTRNQGYAVKGNALREVTGNERLVVHKTRTTHVDEEWKLTADEGAAVEVGGSAKLDMKPDEITVEAPSGITFKCGDNKIEMTPSGITLQTSAGAKVALEGPMVNVEGGANVTVKAGAMLTIQGVMVKIN